MEKRTWMDYSQGGEIIKIKPTFFFILNYLESLEKK